MIPNLPQAIDNGLRTYRDTWDDTVLHVSDLSAYLPDAKCPRGLWMRLKGMQKKELSLGKLLMFDHGNRIHDRVVTLLDKGLDEWTIVDVEMKVSLPFGIIGRLDTLLEKDGHRVVVDYKTMRGRAFGYLTEPKPMHVLQVQTYSLGVDADYGIVLYIDREGQNRPVQYIVERNDARVMEAIEFAEAIVGMPFPPLVLPPKMTRNANKGPDSLKLELPWQCQYCDYIDISCTPCLAPNQRVSGIVGHVDGESFKPKDGCEHMVDIVKEYLGRETA